MFGKNFERALNDVNEIIDKGISVANTSRNSLTLGQHDLEETILKLNNIKTGLGNDNALSLSILGTTGAGKSTLINAILGMEILPESSSGICTASVTRIRRGQRKNFRVEILYISEESIEQDINRVLRQIEMTKAAEDERFFRIDDGAIARLKAIFGQEAVEIFENSGDKSQLKFSPDAFERIKRKKENFEANNADVLRKNLRMFLDSQINQESKTDNHIWPLVESVLIEGNFENLPFGLEIIDLPGLNDPNEAREHLTLNHIRNSKFTFVAYNIKRYETKDIDDALNQPGLVEQLYGSNSANSITFIATHCDQIEFSAEEKEKYGKEASGRQKFLEHKIIEHKTDKMPAYLTKLAEQVFKTNLSDSSRFFRYFSEAPIFVTAAKRYFDTQSGDIKNTEPKELQDSIKEVRRHINKIVKEEGPQSIIQRVKQDVDIEIQRIENVLGAQRAKEETMVNTDRAVWEKLKEHLNQVSGNLSLFLDNEINYSKGLLWQASADLLQYIELAPNSVENFRKHFSRYVSGLPWNTLAATVANNGRYNSSGAAGLIDLRSEIQDPIRESCVPALEIFYEKTLQQILQGYETNLVKRVDEWTLEALEKLMDRSEAPMLESFIKQPSIFIDSQLEKILSETRDQLSQTLQQITEVLREQTLEALRPYCNEALNERGAGMKQRICRILCSGADKAIQSVFLYTREAIKNRIESDRLIISTDLDELNQMVKRWLKDYADLLDSDKQKPQLEINPSLTIWSQNISELRLKLRTLQYDESTSETNTPSLPYVVIDGSNVATVEIDGRKKVRLALLKECISAATIRFKSHRIITFVDPNFFRRLEPTTDAIEFKNLVATGKIDEISGKRDNQSELVADRVILETAQRYGAIVISKDTFDDHSNEFPFVRRKNRVYRWKRLEAEVWDFTSLH
jgi:energy-coupling factor transporter ATP-binding protein EcfA2